MSKQEPSFTTYYKIWIAVFLTDMCRQILNVNKFFTVEGAEDFYWDFPDIVASAYFFDSCRINGSENLDKRIFNVFHFLQKYYQDLQLIGLALETCEAEIELKRTKTTENSYGSQEKVAQKFPIFTNWRQAYLIETAKELTFSKEIPFLSSDLLEELGLDISEIVDVVDNSTLAADFADASALYGLLGKYYRDVEDLSNSEKYSRLGLNLSRQNYGLVNGTTLAFMIHLSSTYILMDELSHAEIYSKCALAIFIKLKGNVFFLNISACLNNLGVINLKKRRYAVALDFLMQSVEAHNDIQKKKGNLKYILMIDPSHGLVVYEPNNFMLEAIRLLGKLYESMRDYETASLCFHGVIDITKILNGDNSLNVGYALFFSAEFDHMHKMLNQARDSYLKALSIFRHHLGDHGSTGKCLYKVGAILNILQFPSQAEEYLLEAYAIYEKLGARDTKEIRLVVWEMGMSYYLQELNEQAERYFHLYIQLLNSSSANEPGSFFEAYGLIGIILYKLGKKSEALIYFVKSYEIAKENYGEDHEQTKLALMKVKMVRNSASIGSRMLIFVKNFLRQVRWSKSRESL